MKKNYLTSFGMLLLTPLCLYAVAEDMPIKKVEPQITTSKQAYQDMTNVFGFVPVFFKAYPEAAIAGAWSEYKNVLMNPNTALSGKYKELIGLAVSAQVPCKYCAYAHDKFARLNGATSMQIKESVAIASSTRHWSALVMGLQVTDASFKTDVDRMVNFRKNPVTDPLLMPPEPPQTANQMTWVKYDIQKTFGFIPEFLNRISPDALPGAWQDVKMLQMAETTIPAKYKDLISLAVSAQVPCTHLTHLDTEFAKLDGASEREISEALSVASLTRKWSTVLNGMQVSDQVFRSEIDRIVKKAQAHMKENKVAVSD